MAPRLSLSKKPKRHDERGALSAKQRGGTKNVGGRPRKKRQKQHPQRSETTQGLPAAGSPPARLPASLAPAGSPPVGSPPADPPPASSLSASLPPGGSPFVGSPPADPPPVGSPPADPPPVGSPSATLPPAGSPPASLPPAGSPPASLPPTGSPSPSSVPVYPLTADSPIAGELNMEEIDSLRIKVSQVDVSGVSESDSSTIVLRDFEEPSTPNIRINVWRIESPKDDRMESPARPSADISLPQNTAKSDEPFIEVSQIGPDNGSPHLKIAHREILTPKSDSKSRPFLYDLPKGTSTPRIVDPDVEAGPSTPRIMGPDVEAGPSTPGVADTSDFAGTSVPQVDIVHFIASHDRALQSCRCGAAESIDGVLTSELIDALERSTHDYDPEAEGIREIPIGDEMVRVDALCRPLPTDVPPSSMSQLLNADGVNPTSDLIQAVSERVQSRVPPNWKLHCTDGRFKVELLVPNPRKSGVLRAVNVACDGSELLVQIHMETLPLTHGIYSNELMKKPVPLSPQTVENFSNVVIGAVYAVHFSRMCVGVDVPDCIDQWFKHPQCTLDSNKFEEPEYSRTLRTRDCDFLVSQRKKRCTSCAKYFEAMKRRKLRRDPDGEVHPNTRNVILTPDRLRQKMEEKQKKIKAQSQKIQRMEERVRKMLEKEAVPVPEGLSNDLEESIKDAPEFVKIFWEQQQKAHTVKKASGMRWHPLLLRWALHIKSISSSAYSAMRDSGFIKLPSERTLYEYSHANPAKAGIQHNVIKRLAAGVQEAKSDFFTLFVLMFDEMYIFRNIVFNKGTGEIVGYADLDSVEEEIRLLEKQLGEDGGQEDSAPVAKTVLTYMAKCLGSNARGVVACYPTYVLTREILHSRTWDVIEALELGGVKVLVLCGDGHPVNIAFFNMHKPLTILPSGVIFDTKNIFAWDRPLYFLTDLPHLLKTIRNCFSNSGAHKDTRMLTKNSEYITWKTIIACFKSEEGDVLKCCHKLTPENVFLTSYSVMKVSLAAQVMSKTVALYIRDVLKLDRPETVKFIMFVNDWFDCMNGKYDRQDVAERNPNLASYNSEDDKRFDFLRSFLAYLEEWKAEVAAMNIPDEEKKRRLLSNQSLTGIERTTHAFIASVEYALGKRRTIEVVKKGQKDPEIMKEGYILGRTLQQDDAEHHFSRQRAMGGGSSHPSVAQFLQHETILEAQGNLGFKRSRHRGNTEVVQEKIDVDATLPKRKKVSRRLDLPADGRDSMP